jgi:hypothetical protein
MSAVSKSQLVLYHTIKELFPNLPVQSNYRYRPISDPVQDPKKKAKSVEFDVSYNYPSVITFTMQVYIPTLHLAFEYQGETHYYTTTVLGSAAQRQLSDSAKAKIAKNDGVTLIPIPFWWDKSPSSLAATIRMYRPDLLQEYPQSKPIPSQMPTKLERKFEYQPNVSQEYSDNIAINPTGW